MQLSSLFARKGTEEMKASAKPAQRLPLPGSGSSGGGFFGTLFSGIYFGGWDSAKPDYSKAVVDSTYNSAVGNCLNWIVTSWPQAIPVVGKQSGATFEPIEGHPLATLLLQPSPLTDGRQFMQSLLADWYGAGKGNSYAYIITTASGEPTELQYVPAYAMMPRMVASGLIYEYRAGGKIYTLPASRVLHFRNGINPHNMLLGRDPLMSVQPEIATDSEAADYQYKLLKRGGAPPYVIGPDGRDSDGMVATLTPEDGDYLKAQVEEKTALGKGLVMPVGFKYERIAFDPKAMVIGETQRKSEERIAGAFGLPPVVACLGAGLDRSTFNNYAEARQAAWEDCIIPLQDAFASEASRVLIPLFGGVMGDGLMLAYDRSNVRALQDDRTDEATTAASLYSAGVLSRAQAKRRVGEEPEPGDETVYAGATPASMAPPAPPAPKGKGFYPLPFETAPEGAEQKNVSGGMPASGSDELNRALNSFRAALRNREATAVRAVSAALDVAEAAVQVKLDAIFADIEALPDGEAVSAEWLMRQSRYQTLLLQIQASYREAADKAAPSIVDAQAGQVADAVGSVEGLTRAALGQAPAGVSVGWNALPKEAINAFVGFASDGSPLASLLREIAPDTGDNVRDALLSGIALGENPRQTARAMRQAAGGQLNLSRARAQAIARTETLRAAREATRQSLALNSDIVTGWIWTAARDSRTCRGCWAMHGTKHAISEVLDDHVNGRCVAVPAAKSWAEITGDASLPDTRPVIATGEAVFAGLDATRQQSILGASLYAAYQSGEVTLADCVTRDSDERWGTQRRAATVAEARANADRRLTSG